MTLKSVASPYVVPGDIYGLFTEWGELTGHNMPGDIFFDELRRKFCMFMQEIFPIGFVFIHEELIKNQINLRARQCSVPIVSIDRSYYRGSYVLDITRRMDRDLHSWGLGPRPGAESLVDQVAKIVQKLKRRKADTIVLLDDVLFTKATVLHVIDLFQYFKIKVKKFIAGIAIESAIPGVEARGVEVDPGFTSPEGTEVFSEHDGYIGAPWAGRALIEGEGQPVPYQRPWGKPFWASVPDEKADYFSRQCMELSRELYREIGRKSGTPLRCGELPRLVDGFPPDAKVENVLTFCIEQYPKKPAWHPPRKTR